MRFFFWGGGSRRISTFTNFHIWKRFLFKDFTAFLSSLISVNIGIIIIHKFTDVYTVYEALWILHHDTAPLTVIVNGNTRNVPFTFIKNQIRFTLLTRALHVEQCWANNDFSLQSREQKNKTTFRHTPTALLLWSID